MLGRHRATQNKSSSNAQTAYTCLNGQPQIAECEKNNFAPSVSDDVFVNHMKHAVIVLCTQAHSQRQPLGSSCVRC